MKAIDKNRFREFLPVEEKGLGNAAGSAPGDLLACARRFCEGQAQQYAEWKLEKERGQEHCCLRLEPETPR